MAELAKPGAGLPGFERMYLGWMLKFASAFSSDTAITNRFQQSASTILEITDENDVGLISQTIVIPRLQGIEDSSRGWSVLMVLNHLAKVNRAILESVRSLRSGTVPFDAIRIADFKPDPEADVDAIEQFRESANRYLSFAKSHAPLRTNQTMRHPWFGDLDGHQWHCLAAAHQNIHLRQIYKILAMIGIA